MNSSFCVGVHALVYLSHSACLLSSEELAENICTNPARVRKIMAALKKAGMVKTKEGVDGGYRFEGNPEKLTLDQVADALQIRFVEAAWHSGDTNKECMIASGMADLMDGIFFDLDKECRTRLARISIADLDHKIISRKTALEGTRG
ncbi:MAG: Rrf2 family transcriptional regulator [Lawsonibacter sp.]|nr:Rrf2 family transcriptional regulator [Lawsonibacter sp.]